MRKKLDKDKIIKTMENKTDLSSLSSYDNLECPECGKLCKPKKVLKNGTVVYQSHACNHDDNYSFAIDVNGDLIED